MYNYCEDPSGVQRTRVTPYKDTHPEVIVIEITRTEVIYVDLKYNDVRHASKSWMTKVYPVSKLPGFTNVT